MRFHSIRGGVTAVAVAAIAFAACDRTPTEPAVVEVDPPALAPPGSAVQWLLVECSGGLAEPTLSCQPPAGGAGASYTLLPGDPAEQLIVGGQGTYLQLQSSNVAYNGGTGQFTFDVTLQNLLPQPLATTDGTTLHPAGARIFFHEGPAVTSGSGTVAVLPDGFGTFTASGQPYYQYDEILETGEISAARGWTLILPPTVLTFSFRLYVAAEVPFPNGYVDLGADSLSLQAGDTVHLAPVVRTATGNNVASPDPVVYATDNSAVAVVDANGVITATGVGVTTITATSGPRPGRVVVTVGGSSHLWIGGISSNWADAGNWQRGVVPTTPDSVRIPVVSGGNHYPVLTGPVTVARVEVDADATLSLATFDLTTTGDAITGATGGIQSTTGLLLLTGADGNVAGRLPRTRVTGRYSLTSATTIDGMLSIRSGMLRGGGHHLRVNR